MASYRKKVRVEFCSNVTVAVLEHYSLVELDLPQAIDIGDEAGTTLGITEAKKLRKVLKQAIKVAEANEQEFTDR